MTDCQFTATRTETAHRFTALHPAAVDCRRRRHHATTPSNATSASAPPASALSAPSQAPVATQRRPRARPRRARPAVGVAPAALGLEGRAGRGGLLGREPARPRAAPGPAVAHPRGGGGRDRHRPGALDGAAAVGLVVGVRPHPVARARVEVGRVRAVGEVHDGAPAAPLELARRAALRAGVLGVHRLGAVEPVLDHLPVARVAAGAQTPRSCVLCGRTASTGSHAPRAP